MPRWPGWQRPQAGGPGGRRGGPPHGWRRWAIVAGIGLFVVLLAIATVGGGGPDLPPRSLYDQEFVRQANAACSRSLPALRRERDRKERGESDQAATVRRVEHATEELGRLGDEIRSLPVAVDDQADVRRWLDDWDAYVAVGERFADALRRRDTKSYGRIAADSSRLSERIYAFSQANGVRECVF